MKHLNKKDFGKVFCNGKKIYELIFNKNQKHSGFNQIGYYQFGCLTCPSCKSDLTFSSPEYKNHLKEVMECPCGFKFIAK